MSKSIEASQNVKLGSILRSLNSGFACSKVKLVNDGLLHLRPFNINGSLRIELEQQYRVPLAEAPQDKRELLPSDILFNNTNSVELVGKVALIEDRLDAGFSNHLTRLRIRPEIANPQYVAHYLNSLWARGWFRLRCVRWVGQAAFNTTALKNIDVPLPSLDEQARVVDILEHATGMHRLREQAQAKVLEIVPALYGVMFDRRQNWATLPIEELVAKRQPAIRTGPFGSQLHHAEFLERGIPVLGIDNVVENRFRWTKPRCLPEHKFRKFERFRVFPGDIAITIMGTTGRVAVMPDDLPECMSTKHLCIISFDRTRVNPTFAWAALLWDSQVRGQIRRVGHGAIMEGWNMTIIRHLRIPVPPPALQQEFSERISEIESIIALTQKVGAVMKQLSQSLVSRVFRNGGATEALDLPSAAQ